MFRYLKITFITLICLIACLIIYTCMSTQFSFKDITSERIPILQNRPTNIEKDIVVDLTMIWSNGGIATYAEEVIRYMIHNKPNHRWIILYNQNKNYTDFLEKLAKDSNSIILIEIPQVAKTHESGPFHKFYVRIISV